jgi:GNAT superfamily N-acetyltransferase
MSDYTVKALSADTWDAFARLAERHNGVFGGCWCTWFHTLHAEKTFTAEGNRALKQRLVEEGRAHAALVFDGDEAVAWCEYGTPEELPNIYHSKQYDAELDRLPDYRITCMFVDKKYRRQGLTAVALRGALDLISQAGGGVVEGYPHDTDGPESIGSLRRHPEPLRPGRVQLRPSQRDEELRDAQGNLLTRVHGRPING